MTSLPTPRNPSMTDRAAKISPIPMLQRGNASGCRQQESQVVSGIPQHQVEAELDAVIRELGDKSVQAMKDGDPTGAEILSKRMYAAIASRTPEHQARLHAEADERVTERFAFFNSDAAVAMSRPGWRAS